MPTVLSYSGSSQPWHDAHGPSAIFANNRTTFVFSGQYTLPFAVQYNHSTEILTLEQLITSRDTDGVGSVVPEADDHSAPVITRDASGTLHVISGSRPGNFLHTSSDSADDITAWTDQAAVGTADAKSYPLAAWVGSKLYVFFRRYDVNPRPISYQTWTSGGGWSAIVDLFAAQDADDWSIPQTIAVSGDKIYVGWLNRSVSTPTLYGYHDPAIVVMDTASSDALESVFGTALSTPITLSEYNSHCLLENTGGGTDDHTATYLRLDLDESNKVHAVYNYDDAGTDRVRYAEATGVAWAFTNITTAVGQFSPKEIIVNSSTDVDVFVPQADGTIHRWNSATSWTNDETITTASRTRPMQRVRDGHADIKLIICEDDNDDYGSDLRFWAWGDSGLFTLPTESPRTLVSEITIDNTQVSGSDKTRFPMLLPNPPTDSAIWTTAKSDGSDIQIFASDGTTQFPVDIRSFDATGKEWTAFALVNFAGASDTVLQVRADGTSTGSPSNSYWGSQGVYQGIDGGAFTYARVYPLDSASVADKTAKNTGETVNGSPTTATGVYGWSDAINFDGVNDHIELNSRAISSPVFMVQALIKPDTITANHMIYGTDDNVAGPPAARGLAMWLDNDDFSTGLDNLIAAHNFIGGAGTDRLLSGNNSITAGTGYTLHWRHNGVGTGTQALYVDGVSKDTGDGEIPDVERGDDNIGSGPGFTTFFDGLIQELRVVNGGTLPDVNWLATEHANYSARNTFASWADADAGVTVAPSPLQNLSYQSAAFAAARLNGVLQ